MHVGAHGDDTGVKSCECFAVNAYWACCWIRMAIFQSLVPVTELIRVAFMAMLAQPLLGRGA